MTQTSVPAVFLMAVLFGFFPGVVVRLATRLWPRGHERREELRAELDAVPYWKRPIWAAEMVEIGLFEGLAARRRQRQANKIAGHVPISHRFAAATLVVLVAPVLALAMIALRLTGRGGSGVLFRRNRSRPDGTSYVQLTFRTVSFKHNPDETYPELRPSRLGNFLSATHLDELPQLFNVVRGDVTLPKATKDFLFITDNSVG